VDDESPDGTGELADHMAAEGEHLFVLHRRGERGLGGALLAGFRWALERDYGGVITIDADLSHRPEDLSALLAAAYEADLVVGSRFAPGAEIEGLSWFRSLFSRGVRHFSQLLLATRCRDVGSNYRYYRAALLRQLDLDRLRSRGYSFQEEMLFRVRRAGGRIREVPIIFARRRAGESKVSASEILRSLGVVVRLSLERFRHA
jgi:dolichol-phosphate mannosyltransferase